MTKPMTLEELVKKYLDGKPKLKAPVTYDLYKHQKNAKGATSYADSLGSLYASAKKNKADYGANSRIISNKGLQNSGYSAYIDSLSKEGFNSGLEKIKSDRAADEAKARASYADYLDAYANKLGRVKKSVLTHLVNGGVTDINTAIAYGMSVGLSKEDAELVGNSAYEVTKKKIFDKLLEQTVSLGLDKEGARLLAVNMGVSDDDAKAFADNIDELLKHYSSLSDDYLDYLEQRKD